MSSYKTSLATLRGTLLALGLLAASGGAMAQSAVTLTAQPTTANLPDGQSVPMWGYFCGAVSGTGVSCSAATGATQTGTAWQPPLIRVPAGAALTITLANQLSVPTSIVIDGQLGGGLGDAPVRMASPVHPPQGTTWPGTVGDATPSSCSDGTAGDTGTFCPPAQGARVRSFATEVAAGATNTTLTWADLRPGTYLIHSGTEPSIQHPMGLYGVLVVTEDAASGFNGTAYSTNYDADVPLLFSEIDPVQNAAVAAAVAAPTFNERATFAGPGMCKDPDTGAPSATIACYPPAVNYSPRYYLINGVSFDRTNLAASTAQVAAAGASGNVLLRLVNAGLRLHVPSVVGTTLTPLAEDGNPVSGATGVQDSMPMSPGKTYDAVIRPTQTTTGTYDAANLPVFDRQLSLSTENSRDGGMQAYIAVAGGLGSGVGSTASQVALGSATNLTFYCVTGNALYVTDPSAGLLRGVTGANGVALAGSFGSDVSAATLQLNADGTFTYTPSGTATASNQCGGTFQFTVNGVAAPLYTATIQQCDAHSGDGSNGCTLAGAPTASDFVAVSQVASRYASPPPGVLAHVSSPGGLTLSAVEAGGVRPDGSFAANGPGTAGACPGGALASQVPAGATCAAVPYTAMNAQGQTANGTAYVAFLPASNLAVTVKDGPTGKPVSDYRWIIEEDRTFWIDPSCQTNGAGRPASCPPLPVESLGYSFHSAHMPVVATGCVGTVSCQAGQQLQGADAVCDIGNGVCRTDAAQWTEVNPSQVHLDPAKRYYISILPGDAINPTISGWGGTASDCGTFDPTSDNWKLYDPADGSSGNCGHEMGGAQVAQGVNPAVTINLQQIPLPTAKISVFVFEDDNPLNGENDAGGGVDIIAPNEPGLGGFEIKLFDQAGQLGDATGQITYDEFNEPVSNSLAGYIDPLTNLDACPITKRTDRLVGMIPTCPKYESDNKTPSPLAGQAVIDNMYPGLYEVQAFPPADSIARGEEWVQTNTLDGGKPHEAFIKPNEPGYFQEFGPGGYHVAIGFANPATINARKAGYCSSSLNAGQPCTNTLNVKVTNNHMSRTPDQRTFDSGTYDHYSFTQCYVSVGPADAEDFAFEKCDTDGKVSFKNMPPGVFKMTVFDQWNDIMLDGLVGTIEIAGGGATTEKVFPVTQWRTNLATRTYIDTDGSGVSTDDKPGLALVNTNIRYRDGSIGFFNNTDLDGYAGFNEVFPLMNWLVVETSQTRFKPTWTHVVYDAGGPTDCTTDASILGGAATPPCTVTAAHVANTDVRIPLPADLRVPGAKYCDNADCPAVDSGDGASTGMLFPSQAFGNTIGWQGLLGQNTFIDFGVKPFKKATANTPAENGGIHGQVIYSSTRPFDDPSLLLQLSWSPGIPHATVNLYSKSTDAQGHEVLQLVDHTESASWDDWAQGFRKGADGTTPLTAGSGANAGYVPNMNCPGQDASSPFFATLKDSKQYLDPARNALAYRSQFKCYDGWSQLNQAQPAPYDGYYSFPSITAINPANGKPSGTNCSACIVNPDDGNPMLPAGDYVVEVIVPPGYELIKEEDKNILMGDVYVAPVTQQFAGFGNIYILPDQAEVNSAYNASNPGNLNNTNSLGAQPRHEGDTGSVEAFWPCAGALRQVPDYNSEFPGAGQAAPFAGAMRRLCDRKEVKLNDESSTLAKFYLFSDTHIAGHFTGTITNDFASEFDPFSPQFGEKFGPPNLPVGLRDFNGNEVARVYSDQWGIYNGLYFSTWSPNPPNPTGYAPQMSIACMNDPGPIVVNGVSQTDPAYNPAYSNFCYEQPFMPGVTTYMDTPVIPTQSFADGYNLPDAEYPDHTPAVLKVVNSSPSMPQGPWVPAGTTATASFTVSGVNRCASSTCSGRSTLTFLGGTVSCDNNNTPGPNCSSTSATTRANNFAAYIRSNVTSLVGAGYTASGTGANVVITAPTSGAAANGTVLASAKTNLGSPAVPVLLAGGTDPDPASLHLTITALGDKNVQNPNYTGPNATVAPYNQKTITRHYDFGAGGTGYSAVLVAPDGTTTAPLTIDTWTNTSIAATVPTLPIAFNCKMQQRNAPTAQCGQLVITRGDNGKRSVDAITVTVGGSAPWVVTPTDVVAPTGKTVKDYAANFGRLNLALNAAHQSTIQVAIDSADPGDLILVTPGTDAVGTYHENVIMWKPVRLQGVGATAAVINADAHPAGHMDQWRRQVDCVFGLSLDGIPNIGNDQASFRGADPANAGFSCPDDMFLTGDRIPFEAITGWQATGNGNLAQVLQEPTLMGAYEGAGITVVGRGVRVPNGSPFFLGNDPAAAGGFPDNSRYLGSSTTDCTISTGNTARQGGNYGASNFYCNPSRIDGLSVLNSSQGGGGLFLHGWSHNMEIGNNRISANHGTLAGAINLGNGETPGVYLNDGTICGAGVVSLCPPIPSGTPTNAAIPFAFNTGVRIHHNMLYNNASIGDALWTGTPAGAGGVTVSAGGDNYQIDHNWIAGNLTTGDGGGIQSLGVTFNGKINNNYVLFNQSTNPTLPTNGGGISIQGANEPRTLNGTECGTNTDADCPFGLGDGVGDGLVIDSNLVMGNSAESGMGGGIVLEQINGSEMITFPLIPARWYAVTLSNNIIANNVAGYDGGGVALRDALKVTMVNNTIASNDTTATAGVLFKTLGAINATSPPPGCNSQTNPALPQDPSCLGRDAPHGPQPSGLVTMAHTQNLNEAIGGLTPILGVRVLCPVTGGFGYTGLLGANGDCMKFSRPALVNDLFWQNRTFSVDIVGAGSGLQSQQNLVALAPALDQTAGGTGSCPAGANYWDIGLRTDDVNSGLISPVANRLVITNSVLTGDTPTMTDTVASGTNRIPGSSPVIKPTCNGARTPPEGCSQLAGGLGQNCHGFNAPPGASETTSLSQLFVFNGIQPTATVDEGHNWLNLNFGPLTLSRVLGTPDTSAEVMVASASVGTTAGAYSIPTTSAAVNGGVSSGLPSTTARDFFGNARGGANGAYDIGAVECQGTGCAGSGGGGNSGLPLLDDFTRGNAFNLGSNWNQPSFLGIAAIGINNNAAQDPLTPGVAYWTAAFGASQGAGFTFVTVGAANNALVLKATGGTSTAPASYIQVRYTGTGVQVRWTTNSGGTFTQVGATMATTFAIGDTFSATVSATGLVTVSKNGTSVGTAQLPNVAAWTTGGGRIGMQLTAGTTVDNFVGGTVP